MTVETTLEWQYVANVSDFPKDLGVCVKIGNRQIAVFYFASKNEWYACQNLCPHKRDMVLSRGLIGDCNGIPKVACPMHKKSFSLEDGKCLSGENYEIKTYNVKVEDGKVFVNVPNL